MKVYSGVGIGDMYYQLVRDITEYGRRVDMGPGKGACLELPEPITLIYEKPGHCWMRIPHRKWNPFLAVAEILWILSGSGNVDWISYFSSNMRSFQDGTKLDFHAAYGMRIRKWEGRQGSQTSYRYFDQIIQVIAKLKENPNSRQAIISIWDPERDNLVKSKDIPCNNWIGYTLRDGILEQTVVIRSNDLVWGTPYNAVQFTHIHAYIAGCLGVEMGKFTYVINNLHYYQELYKPTLTNLIEQAYGSQPLKAERAQRFSTITENSFKSTQLAWGLIRNWKPDGTLMPIDLVSQVIDAEQVARGILALKIERGSFIEFDLPILLWIYAAIKERNLNKLEARKIVEALIAIGEPFISLFKDFYSGSKNESSQKVLEYL